MPSNVSFTLPGSEYQAEADRIARQRQLAEALQQQAVQPIAMPNQPGVAVSPFSGLAKMLRAHYAKEGIKKADEEQKALAGQVEARRGADMSLLAQALRGRQAQPEMVDEVAGTTVDALPAQKPSQSLQQAVPLLRDPSLQQFGMQALVEQLKSERPKDPKWQVTERFDAQGRPQKVLVDLNNPTNIQPFGAAKASDPGALVEIGPDGKPRINPLALAAKKAVAAAGKPETRIDLGKDDDKYLAERRKAQAAQFAALEKSAESAYKQKQTLDRFIEASEKGTAGGAQPIISGVQNFLASFGYTPEQLKDVRVMEQAIGDILGNKMAELGARGLTDKDMEILRQALPRVAIDKASRKAVAEILKKSAEFTLDEYANARAEEERIYPEFAKKTPVQGWFRAYRESKKKSLLPDGVTQEEWDAMTPQDRALFQQ